MLPPTLVFIIVIALQAFYAAANIDDKLIIYSIYRDLDTFGELYVAPRVDSNYGYQLDKETFSDMIDKIKNTHPDKLECSTFGFPPGLCLALTKGGAFLKKSGWILVRGWLLGGSLEVESWEGCPSLEVIKLECFQEFDFDRLPHAISNVINYMTCSDTKLIEFWGGNLEETHVQEFMKLLGDAEKKKRFNLEFLSLELEMVPLNVYPLREFELVGIVNLKFLLQRKFHSTLKVLKIPMIDSESTATLFELVPTGIEELELRSNSINWDVSDCDLSKFAVLKRLNLSDTRLGNYVEALIFPESLKVLDVGYNNIDSVDKVSFPMALEILDVSSNRISSVDKVDFPNNLNELNASRNCIKRLCSVDFPSGLKALDVSENYLESIDIGRNNDNIPLQIEVVTINSNKCPILGFNWSKLPSSVKVLSFENYKTKQRFFEFGKLVVSASLRNSDLSVLERLNFKANCNFRRLDVSACNLSSFDFDLPETILEIDLSGNELKEFPQQLDQLKFLRVLNLSKNQLVEISVELPNAIEILDFSDNQLSEVNITFASDKNAIEILDLSNNSIRELQLSFEKGPSKLQSLNLRKNQLKEFSMETIGHGKKSFHDSLFEINLYDNGDITNENIESLISELSKSTKCLWWNRTFTQASTYNDEDLDRFALNELNGNLASSMRVDPIID
ncbi:hypothetical protein CANMA_002012 [Candida margitis]|uniref:uncharacterized protein n=1 Tax=Candida margitis TaxID=1775924 RepID=UPI0022266F08|nr:uncharacterized protein CANMA_002012 [Candida margitis]KAI5968953.1 hypothetical protein CANMA_002012 [Candida margitis]